MTQTIAKTSLWRSFAASLTAHPSFGSYFEPLLQLVLPQWTTVGHRARVLKVRTELRDVYTLVLKPSRLWGGFKAGQFIQITAEKDGIKNSRFFSISSSPAYFERTGLIELSIRVQDKGRITPWLREHFASGGFVSLSPAQGEFVLPDSNEPLLCIAGGSGITPFRSMLQQLATENSARDVHLMYFARDREHYLFREELQTIEQSLPNITITLLNNEQHGLINADVVEQYCPDFARRQAMICGPAPMIALARSILQQLQVSAENIHYEYFGAAPIDHPRASADTALVAFRRSNVTADVQGEPARSLLDVAESAGLKPVSGCRIGVCHQCICKKQSGVVFNTLTGQYSDTGSGEIQLCVSVAASDLVLDL